MWTGVGVVVDAFVVVDGIAIVAVATYDTQINPHARLDNESWHLSLNHRSSDKGSIYKQPEQLDRHKHQRGYTPNLRVQPPWSFKI